MVVEVATDSQHAQRTVPMLRLQFGLSYSPPALPGLTFVNGYEYDRIFDVASVGPSTGEVYSHGFFMRARFDF